MLDDIIKKCLYDNGLRLCGGSRNLFCIYIYIYIYNLGGGSCEDRVKYDLVCLVKMMYEFRGSQNNDWEDYTVLW